MARSYHTPETDDPPDEGEDRDTIILEDDVMAAGYAILPTLLLRDHSLGLSHSAKLTYAILLTYAWKERRCFPGQARLAVDLDTTRQATGRYLAELKEAGLIRVTRRGLGKTNVYTLPKLGSVLNVTPAFHQGVTHTDPPKGTKPARPKGTAALPRTIQDRDYTTTIAPQPPASGRVPKQTRKEKAEDPDRFFRPDSKYPVCRTHKVLLTQCGCAHP